MAVTDEVWQRLRAGDPAAFALVVEAQTHTLRTIAARFFASPFDQEEALQEIWSQVWRGRQGLDPQRLATAPAWLATLARNRCLDLLRQRARQPAIDGRAAASADIPAGVPEAWSQGTPEEQPGHPLRQVEAQEILAAATAFVQRLKPAWRDFFQLHFVQGLDLPDAAERLGLSRWRAKYLRRRIAARARKDRGLLAALGRWEARG